MVTKKCVSQLNVSGSRYAGFRVAGLSVSKYRMLCCLLLTVFLLVLPAMAMATVHTVKSGDSIYKISHTYNVSQYSLRYSNNLWTDTIKVGEKLNIPERYVVQKTDSFYNISKKTGVSVSNLKNINQANSNSIYPGQILYIPSKNIVAGAITDKITSVSASDLDLLARIISAESASESYTTQVAVGATVLNRVKSPLFPNSISGVVYQIDSTGRYQFEPVKNGWINQPATASAKKAAQAALNGWDPTNGALYFFESWVTNKFLQSRPVSMILDAFTFSY